LAGWRFSVLADAFAENAVLWYIFFLCRGISMAPNLKKAIHTKDLAVASAGTEIMNPTGSLKTEIATRLRLPKDQWIDMTNDTVFDDVIRSMHERQSKS
jgi:hypothetical protein